MSINRKEKELFTCEKTECLNKMKIIICFVRDRKPFVACGFCGVKILPDWLQHNKQSRYILGVHTNIISAVKV